MSMVLSDTRRHRAMRLRETPLERSVAMALFMRDEMRPGRDGTGIPRRRA